MNDHKIPYEAKDRIETQGPKEKEARKSFPNAFALTYEEWEKTEIFYDIVSDAITKYADIDGKGNVSISVTAESQAEAAKALEEYGYSYNEVVSLTERILSSDWWTMFLTSTPSEGGVAFIRRNDKGKLYGRYIGRKASEINFFLMNIEQQRDFLGFPETCRFIPFSDHASLTFLKGVFTGYGEQKAGKESKYNIIEDIDLQLFSGETKAVADKTGGLENLISVLPKAYVINNSKIAQNINKAMLGAGEIGFNVGTAKKPMNVVASLAYDDEAVTIASGRRGFDAYDRTVHNGVCTVYQAGNKQFTPEMVYRAMNGITDTRYISPKAVEKVAASIEKQRAIRLFINCEEQAKKYPNITQLVLDDYLVSAERLTALNNGAKAQVYQFNKEPILYRYSRSIGQVLSVPPRLLNTATTVNTTDDVIVIREYLIRRIEGMKGKNALRSECISYEAIFAEIGVDESKLEGHAKKDIPKRVRKNVNDILAHLKSEGFIKGFGDYKDGRKIAGIKITL